MRLIEIAALDNGAHRNYTVDGEAPIPFGWAIIPEDMATPDSFPFVNIEVDEQDGAMTVTSMTAGVMPEPEPAPAPVATQLDVIEAQVTYTAMMTGTLLEG